MFDARCLMHDVRCTMFGLRCSCYNVLLHVLVVGHAGHAVGADFEDLLHDGAHIEEGGRLGDAGIGISVLLSVFIYSVCQL